MAGNAEINGLLAAAKCFDCLPDPILWEAETFLYAYITGAGTDPTVLASESRCLSCLNPQTLFEIKAYLLAVISGGSLDPNAIIAGARCNSCIPDGKRLSVDVYLLSQDPSAPPGLTPNSLAQQANAFRRMSGVTLLEIQVWVLAGAAAVDRTPNALAAAAKCFGCIPGGFVPLVTTSLLKDIEDGDGIPGGCTDVPADLVPVIEATYTDGALSTIGVTLPKVCCEPGVINVYEADAADGTGAVLYDFWPVPVAGGTANYTHDFDSSIIPPTKAYIVVTQVCDGGTESAYSNALTVAQPNCGVATSVITVSGAGVADANGDYLFDAATSAASGYATYINPVSSYTIEFTSGDLGVEALLSDAVAIELYELPIGECFPCATWIKNPALPPAGAIPTMAWGSEGSEEANAWAARVVTNGGARPSNATIAAASVFLDALDTAGIKNKFKTLNIFASDNLTACLTPLIVGVGSDPWTNNNFVAGDLTLNGLGGNGVNKTLVTGINASTVFGAAANNVGMSFYCSTETAANMNMGATTGVPDLLLSTGVWDCWNSTTQRVNHSTREAGFYSGNRIAANNSKCFFASGANAFAQVGATVAEAAGAVPNATITVFDFNTSSHSTATCSFAAVHEGLTPTEAEALYNAVQALRVALGGGYVADISNAAQMAAAWSLRVVVNGGAAPAGSTVTAITDFWQDLIDAAINTKMKMVNIVAPDNLTAALVPVMAGKGLDIWTNTGPFVGGDLTVNGLKGNGTTKYLKTGLVPTRLFSGAGPHGGISCYVSVGGGAGLDFGSQDGTGALAFNLFPELSGTCYFDCYSANAGRASFAQLNFTGFTSGNRTSAIRSDIYTANSGLAIGSRANDTNNVVGENPVALESYAWALNNNGAPLHSDKRMSFVAVHLGLTLGEVTSLYNAVQALRTALGGGYV